MPTDDHRRPRGGPLLERGGGNRDGHGIDDLLVAAGHGDLQALAAFYDKTAPVVFGLLHSELGHPTLAEQATRRVYLQLWRTAATFEPTTRSAYSLLLRTTRRELSGRVHGILTLNRAAPGIDEDAEPARHHGR